MSDDLHAAERILVVDDSSTIRRLLEIELRSAGFDVRTASDGREALEAARDRCPELILADVMMPEMGGLELTHHLREDPRTAGVSIILITARGMSADKLEGLAAGADDYIVKPFDNAEMLARVKGVLRRSRELRAQSPLTRLPGNIRIQEEIQQRVEEEASFCLLYADLDNFKAYNDYYGFARGDEVLQAAARIIQEVSIAVGGPETFVGHVGGDDFVVVSHVERWEQIADAIVERFDREAPALYDPLEGERGYIEIENRRGEMQQFPLVSISIGVATTEKRAYTHYAEAVSIASEMKTFTKRTAGSSWAVDRRTD
ncbi:MAG TPA: response regulator [Actinomycetota bacterium]